MLIPRDGFTAEELAEAGATTAGSLSQLASVLRAVLTEDEEGGETRDWQCVATLECRISKVRTMRDVIEGGKLQTITLFHCDFAVGSDVRPSDRISVEGQTFEVVDTDRGLADAAVLTAHLVRLGPQ